MTRLPIPPSGDADNGTVGIVLGSDDLDNHSVFWKGGDNGTKGDHIINIWGKGGDAQTKSGHKGRIIFAVGYGPGNDKVLSEGFSVDAIPDKVTEVAWNPKAFQIGNVVYGLRLALAFHSDSLQPEDLVGHITALEKVKLESASGVYKNNPPRVIAS